MKGEEVEAATEFSQDDTEATQGREVVADDATVTETVPENAVMWQLPRLNQSLWLVAQGRGTREAELPPAESSRSIHIPWSIVMCL